MRTTKLKNDELNINSGEKKRRSVPYEEYFGEMPLTKENKRKRIRLASSLEVIFLFYLTMLLTNEVDFETAKEELKKKFEETVKEELGYKTTPSYVGDYIDEISEEIIDSTEKHIEDPYYTSNDRAMFIAEDNSNAMWNYWEFTQAVKSGNNMKRWRAIIDNATRDDHFEADGQIVPIFEPFDIGGYQMMFPKDASLGASAKEIINCRCICEYYKL